MSRLLEQLVEERSKKRQLKIVAAIEFELERSVQHAGAELVGFSVKLRPGECLLVLRVILAGRDQVAFVGAEDLGSCLIKAVHLARSDKLAWRADKYVGQS